MLTVTQRKIYDRVIRKAVKRGWEPAGVTMSGVDAVAWARSWPVERVIFDFDFARALWRDTDVYLPADFAIGQLDYRNDTVACNGWKYHLQQLVVSEDRIAYLSLNT